MKIGVLSDTHISGPGRVMPPAIFAAFRDVDLIMHAGDLTSEEVLIELAALAPVEAVYGNVDPPALRRRLPRQRLIELEGKQIGLIHGDGSDRQATPARAAAAFPGADCVVFGHSHQPLCERRGATLLFNPGSPTEKRRMPQPSYGLLYVTPDGVDGEIHFF